jgi:hypothetical protein
MRLNDKMVLDAGNVYRMSPKRFNEYLKRLAQGEDPDILALGGKLVVTIDFTVTENARDIASGLVEEDLETVTLESETTPVKPSPQVEEPIPDITGLKQEIQDVGEEINRLLSVVSGLNPSTTVTP